MGVPDGGGVNMTDSEREKRLIEVELPLREISDESRSEKYRSYGRLSNLHRWWAPRPLAASRVAAYASLVRNPDEKSSREQEVGFLQELCKWDSIHNQRVIRRAKQRILSENNGDPPRILDPFSGAGNIPLEAKRIGCEAHGLEYNPVAFLLNLAVLEYTDDGAADRRGLEGDSLSVLDSESNLIRSLRKWSSQVVDLAEEELDEVYGENEVHYIWARTVPCQNPECSLEIPLVRSFWLSDNEGDRVIYDMECDQSGQLDLTILHEEDFEEIEEEGKTKFRRKDSGRVIDPGRETVLRGSVSCPACNGSFKAKTTKQLGRAGKMDERLMIVVETGSDGKEYRLPEKSDLAKITEASKRLDQYKDALPQEEIPLNESSSRYLTPRIYGYTHWRQLFNPRQQLMAAVFVDKLRDIRKEIASEEDDEYAKIIVTYLALALDKMLDYNSSLVAWQKGGEKGGRTYTRSALPMRWDYVESNPLGEGNAGSWAAAMDLIPRALDTASGTLGSGEAHLGSATRLPFPENHFDAVLTDPPYYDNVPYAALSDFFYVWLKKTLGPLYSDLFSTPLTPKSGEIIEDKAKHGDGGEAEEFFEKELEKAFQEIRRVLKPDGITTIVFAHKSTEAWAQMIRSLLASGLIVTATWPIHTEKMNRVRSMGSASLASSIYFVCRTGKKTSVGYYTEVQEELESRVHESLDQFWKQGVRGADLLVSAIGPATEVFGKYESIKRLSGESVRVDQLLEDTQRLVSEYALGKVLTGDITLGSLDPETRFYILYRWAFANQKEDYDEVRKLAQVNDADPERLERLGILQVTRGDAKLRPPQDRSIPEPQEMPDQNDVPIIDKIHRAAILWEDGRRSDLTKFIEEHCMEDEFWRSAQAIAECLPEEEAKSKKEKQMLHGLLGYSSQVDLEGTGQLSLTDYSTGGGKDD